MINLKLFDRLKKAFYDALLLSKHCSGQNSLTIFLKNLALHLQSSFFQNFISEQITLKEHLSFKVFNLLSYFK